MTSPLANYLLALADDDLILGHRVSEWCGHAPILEEDIAFSSLAQDAHHHRGTGHGHQHAHDDGGVERETAYDAEARYDAERRSHLQKTRKN